jgi:two-component system nitrate/nitrite response regulator NarP
MTRVLVADDDPLTAAGIEGLLAGSGFEIVARARTGNEVLETLAPARPEILVLGIRMADRSGLDVLRILRARGDPRRVVLLTGSADDRDVHDAVTLGVDGVVIEATVSRDLLPCLESVARGRRWLPSDVAQRAIGRVRSPDNDHAPFARLSARERGVVALVQRGLRNKEIAAELGLTEGTVKVHLHRIFEKLRVSSRAELIRIGSERTD